MSIVIKTLLLSCSVLLASNQHKSVCGWCVQGKWCPDWWEEAGRCVINASKSLSYAGYDWLQCASPTHVTVLHAHESVSVWSTGIPAGFLLLTYNRPGQWWRAFIFFGRNRSTICQSASMVFLFFFFRFFSSFGACALAACLGFNRKTFVIVCEPNAACWTHTHASTCRTPCSTHKRTHSTQHTAMCTHEDIKMVKLRLTTTKT